MAIEIRVPSAGESITKVLIANWLKREGDSVTKDEIVVEIETDKATLEVPAPEDGVLGKILKQAGENAQVGDLIATLNPAAAGRTPTAAQRATAALPAVSAGAARSERAAGSEKAHVMPAAQRAMSQAGLTPADVSPSGPGGRILKEDVERRVAAGSATAAAKPLAGSGRSGVNGDGDEAAHNPRHEEAVPMSPIRQKIAQRLVEAKQTTALLTTFNEIDMGAIMELRQQYQDAFVQKYGVKLGFMSFFIKAAIDALKQFPQVNAEIRELPGPDGVPIPHIVYKNYYDIGVAVGGGKGLVVPVIRNAERLSFAEVEQAIGEFGARARDNKIKLEELIGGTFTISNGGIYGSMMSTPIINPPQSAILGLHAIQDRPMARQGQVVIRPMMYVALTYDHRVIDGREAVTFLKRIKEAIESPTRMLLEV